jgi:hypothetical protein
MLTASATADATVEGGTAAAGAKGAVVGTGFLEVPPALELAPHPDPSMAAAATKARRYRRLGMTVYVQDGD